MTLLEVVAKLLCPEKSMILRSVARGSEATPVHWMSATPCGSAKTREGPDGPSQCEQVKLKLKLERTGRREWAQMAAKGRF